MVNMPRCSYPINPWLFNFIVHQKKGRSATTLHVLKCIDGPFPDGSKMMLVGDGELLITAQFAADSFEKLEASEEEEIWEKSLIMVKDWDIRLLLKETKEKSEYIMDIKRFVIWYDETGLSSKNTMVPCESHPQIQENIARIWAENHPFNQLVSDPQDSDKTDNTVNSIPLTILLEEIEKGNDKSSSEEESFNLIPNAGSILTVSAENLQQKFETENIQDFIINPKDAELLEAIVEWQNGNNVSENAPEKSTSEIPVSVLAGTSTLKYQFKPSKVCQKTVVVTPTTLKRCLHQDEIMAPRPNSDAEEEEIRLFNLSSVLNEDRCSPMKDDDQSFGKNVKDSSKVVPCPATNEAAPVSSASNTSVLNKDSTEASFEIPMSGKVASNYNASKSNSDDLHCSLFDSTLDTSPEKRLTRWNNLDMSSIESEKQFVSVTCADKVQREVNKISKRIKLTHATDSTRSSDSQGSLLNQPLIEPNNKKTTSKSSTLSTFKSNLLDKSGSQEDAPNEAPPTVSHRHLLPCLVKTSLAATEKTNLLTNSLCKEAQPVEIYATCQEMFPKHASCLSLLPSSNQLTVQNNLNNIHLPKETMESINAYWSLSHNHLWQKR